jgi:hypothetical protein
MTATHDDVAAALAARQARGDTIDSRIPADLDAELNAHWSRVAGQPPSGSLDTAIGAIASLREWRATPTAPPTTSRVPGASVAHRAIGGTVRRHEQLMATQLDDLVTRITTALSAVLAADLAGPVHDAAALSGRLELLTQRVDELLREQRS